MRFFTNRANQSIFFALWILKRKGFNTIYIPDQGGWITYKHFPKFLDLKIKILRTDKGIPEEEELKEIKNSALILCSSPGYLRDLSKKMWQIKELLNDNKSLLINDNSSGFSDDGDIVLMSFGKWKPINIGLGGLLEIKNEEIQDFVKKEEIDKFIKFQVKLPEEVKNLAEERLKNLQKLVEQGINFANEYKKKFKDYLIKEVNEKSLNVALINDQELIKELKEQKLPFRLMPDYIRLKIKGISLETKKMFFS